MALPEKKSFKILSIDGGGIKGLYSARILEQFEDEYKNPISDYFDLICGTSTGGLIALALALRIPAKTIVEFYRVEGPQIFSSTSRLSRTWRFFQQLLIQSKYPSTNLEAALKRMFGDKKIGDSENFLCIPSFNTTLGKNRVFKFDHEYLIGTDNNYSMVDIGLATSAAPTYFPLHKLEEAYFIDGGVWANNPSLCGLVEAIRFFTHPELKKDYEGTSILSVSSLNHNSGFHLKESKLSLLNPKRYSFRQWNSRLFQVTLDGQSEFVDFFLKTLHSNLDFKCNYRRIPTYEDVGSDNIRFIDLDKASKRSIDVLMACGKDQGLKFRRDSDLKNIFFSTTKNVQLRK